MKITIKTENDKLRAELPYGLKFEKKAPPAVARTIGTVSMDVTAGQALKLVGALQKYKKDHPDWHFMQVLKVKETV